MTTQALTWMGSYGVTDDLNVVVLLPFVWTHASQGVLSSQQGLQDLTLGLK